VTDFVYATIVLFMSYSLATINIRAIAHTQYGFAALTDALIPLTTFLLVRQIAEADSWLTALGMATGGALSSVVGIWITRRWGT
jgi:hypothetical protein